MTSWGDITDRDYVDSITVEVVAARHEDGPKRQWALDVRDREGTRFGLDIWQTHELDIEWVEGATYELTNAYGQTWNGGQQRKLHSSKRFTANRLTAPTIDARLLVVGDSHVGYSNRPRSKQVNWHRDLDCTGSIERVVRAAISEDVEAVIHAGDFFDHEVTSTQLETVRQALNQLRDNRIPLYYVLGNHEAPKGRKFLHAYEQTHDGIEHLDEHPSDFADTVTVQGADYHSTADFPAESLKRQRTGTDGPLIMVVHQSLAPLHDHGEIDLATLVGTPPNSVKYVVCGHLHEGAHHHWRGVDVLYTGSVEKLSRKPDAGEPSGWLLSITDGKIKTQRRAVSR